MSDELARLSASEVPEWAASGHRLFVANGEFLAHFHNERPAELAAAARNALPALLAVALAAAALDAAWQAIDVAASPEATNSAYHDEHVARASLSAAVAAAREAGVL